MEMLHHALAWFDIPVSDFDRAKAFYSALYDYDMPVQAMGSVRMGILLHDRDKGGIGGAIVEAAGNAPSAAGTRVYLNGGRDLKVVLDRVETAGGQVLMPKTPLGPGLGYFAMLRDTEGNVVGLHSPE